jgi:hypothetical protein
MQVAASNSEQIERKKQLAQQEWEEEMRIAEYIRQKDAREQVRLRTGLGDEQWHTVPAAADRCTACTAVPDPASIQQKSCCEWCLHATLNVC